MTKHDELTALQESDNLAFHALLEQYADGQAVNGDSFEDIAERMLGEAENLGVCQHDTDPYGAHTKCGKPATCDDDDFRFAMCDEHAQQAWACMDIDNAMLQNAY